MHHGRWRRNRCVLSLLMAALPLIAACGEDKTTTPTPTPAPPIFVTYGFTSGGAPRSGPEPGGDGFAWPVSPPGMIDDFPSSRFTTPDGVTFFHDIGNNLFFDDAYLLPDDDAVGNGIDAHAMWGQPRPIDEDLLIVPAIHIQFAASVDSIGFDFAWAVSGEAAPDTLDMAVNDVLGGGTFITIPLPNVFDAGAVFANGAGYYGRIGFTVASLAKDYGVVLSGIRHLSIFVESIGTKGSSSAFAVDNFTAQSAAEAP